MPRYPSKPSAVPYPPTHPPGYHGAASGVTGGAGDVQGALQPVAGVARRSPHHPLMLLLLLLTALQVPATEAAARGRMWGLRAPPTLGTPLQARALGWGAAGSFACAAQACLARCGPAGQPCSAPGPSAERWPIACLLNHCRCPAPSPPKADAPSYANTALGGDLAGGAETGYGSGLANTGAQGAGARQAHCLAACRCSPSELAFRPACPRSLAKGKAQTC